LKIFKQTKELVKREKYYTAKILKNLMVIEKDKLYSDLKYPSLHKYIIKELKYSEAEATIRVNAIRLMLKSQKAVIKVEKGELSLTNAAEANRALQNTKDKKVINRIVEAASKNSTREFKKIISKEFNTERKEVVVLNEFMIKKFDKLRKEYGDLSTYELIEILLEEKLNAPGAVRRLRTHTVKNSRSICKQVKASVYTGKCSNCGSRSRLEYDHKVKFSHGGNNSKENIQILCRSCNQRKEIRIRQTNLFN